jgi:membrane protein YqaA with SNARE-associated domain
VHADGHHVKPEVVAHPVSRGILRRLYDWTLQWAQRPHGQWALFILAFAESSFFPIPPDVLLIALCLGARKKSFRLALICSLGSVSGGVFGYLIGWQFWHVVGDFFLAHIIKPDAFERVSQMYNENAFLAVFAAGFTPIPYKVFTVAAGVFSINFPIFVLASAIGRSARFFLVAGLIYAFGAPVKKFIDKYFDILSIVFLILLVVGFIVVKKFL